MDLDWIGQFEDRKKDHIRVALNPDTQVPHLSGFDLIHLVHEAIPDVNFSDVSIASEVFSHSVAAPLFVSSMTAGHSQGEGINNILAEACVQRGWAMALGSQRRELADATNGQISESARLRQKFPNLILFGNIGITQLIEFGPEAVLQMIEGMRPQGLFIHSNPLQEALQESGTPQFKGSWRSLEALTKISSVPVIVKEVGCGFSKATLARLKNCGVAAVDLAGLGGTHWGRVEGLRQTENSLGRLASLSFQDWGHSIVDSLRSAIEVNPKYEIWGSGGVRSGHDAAKLLAMGAKKVGVAQPIMSSATKGLAEVLKLMELYEFELKLSLFCTGYSDLQGFQQGDVWQWK